MVTGDRMSETRLDRLRCFICGEDTSDAVDYLLVSLTSPFAEAQQYFGVHAACFNAGAAKGFRVELHLM